MKHALTADRRRRGSEAPLGPTNKERNVPTETFQQLVLKTSFRDSTPSSFISDSNITGTMFEELSVNMRDTLFFALLFSVFFFLPIVS